MKTTKVKFRYFHAWLPFTFGIAIFIMRTFVLFGDLSETQSGSNKANILSEGITNNLWYSYYWLIGNNSVFIISQTQQK